MARAKVISKKDVPRGVKVHIKSPEYPYVTCCGLPLGGSYHTKYAKLITCKRCKQILRSYTSVR